MDTHKVTEIIKQALNLLNNEADSTENGRIKAITKTKLEESLLWAEVIYPNPESFINSIDPSSTLNDVSIS